MGTAAAMLSSEIDRAQLLTLVKTGALRCRNCIADSGWVVSKVGRTGISACAHDRMEKRDRPVILIAALLDVIETRTNARCLRALLGWRGNELDYGDGKYGSKA